MATSSRDGRSSPLTPTQPCWLEIDLDAVSENVRRLKELIGPKTALAAVVKAEAYGLGAIPMAKAVLAAGADWLAVARVEEGVDLRRAGLEAPILNLAHTSPDEAEAAANYRLTATVVDSAGAEALSRFAPLGQRLPIHLKVDTGLSRLGAQPRELEALLEALRGLPNLELEGLSSHFASADDPDLSFAREQMRRFAQAERLVESYGYQPPLRHLANSAATLALPESRRDMVRVGITLSGNYPASGVPRAVELAPAIAFKARLARVYDLPAGASIGYNRTYVADRPVRAAVVPAGYADGLPRSHSNRGKVLIRGRRAPIIGRVSMDQCVVAVGSIPDARPGDEAVLVGSQGQEHISLDEYAAWGETIVHEALCRIGSRVPRYYRRAGKLRDMAWLGRADLVRGDVFAHAHP
jgi:alanine racemase